MFAVTVHTCKFFALHNFLPLLQYGIFGIFFSVVSSLSDVRPIFGAVMIFSCVHFICFVCRGIEITHPDFGGRAKWVSRHCEV